MLEITLKLVISYLLGSVIGSLVVGRLKGGIDIRDQGSGNAGGTNALRTQGKAFAFWVMVIDIGKGVLAATLIAGTALPGVAAASWSAPALALGCGAAAVVGHVWPLFYGFRGGKGAATYLGVLATCAPWSLLPVLGVWTLSIMWSGYVGLSTVLAAWALPAYAAARTAEGPRGPLFAFGVVMAVFITYTHRSNLARLRAGNENRFQKAMLLRRLFR
jgi:glycerol-3-phosphate acyltransferase PlsY